MSSLLYLLFFCSVLFSQVTVYDSTRISIPIKEISVFIFLGLFPFLLRCKIKSAVWNRFYVVALYSSALTFFYAIWNYSVTVQEMPYPVVAGYICLYFIGILFSQVPFHSGQAKNYFEIGFGLLCINSYIALCLYIAFFIGINPIMLGVNHAAFYRAFGLMSEPSHFSVVSGIALITYVYFVWKVKYFNLNKVKLVMLVLSFGLSQSPTGFAFVVCCLVLYFFKRPFWPAITFFFMAVIIFAFGGSVENNTVARGLDRILYDIEVIGNFFSNNYDFSDDINEYSRAGRLLQIFQWLMNISIVDLLFGHGLGGQNLILPNINNFFTGPIYLLVEIGVIGLSMISLLYAAAFGRGSGGLYWILVPYLLICLVNPPGGIFGAQFLVLVFFLGNASIVASGGHKTHT